MPNLPTSEELDTIFQAFKAVLAHPEFQKTLEEIQGLPEDQRSQAASTQLTPQALMARGIPIRQGMSITTPNIKTPDNPTARTAEAGATQRGTTAPIVALDSRICIWFLGKQYCLEIRAFPTDQ
jgi:hypothetical protein